MQIAVRVEIVILVNYSPIAAVLLSVSWLASIAGRWRNANHLCEVFHRLLEWCVFHPAYEIEYVALSSTAKTFESLTILVDGE